MFAKMTNLSHTANMLVVHPDVNFVVEHIQYMYIRVFFYFGYNMYVSIARKIFYWWNHRFSYIFTNLTGIIYCQKLCKITNVFLAFYSKNFIKSKSFRGQKTYAHTEFFCYILKLLMPRCWPPPLPQLLKMVKINLRNSRNNFSVFC